MSIYMLNKIRTEPEIFGSKVDISDTKRCTLSLKFSLYRQVPEMWKVARGFMAWFFLSWGIDYRIKNVKTDYGRMTSLTFFHPISHCAMLVSMIFNLLDREINRWYFIYK
jgi:hypothetical protein